MVRRAVVGLLLAIWCSASFAIDPLTLILLRVLRDQVISSSAQTAIEGMQRDEQRSAIAALPQSPYDLDDRKLRTLIDEGFVYLTSAQRDEVYAGVQRALSDPKNAQMRPYIIHELALKASAVRQAHERLAGLSYAEKKTIASQARDEYEKLPPEERQQMIQVLQSGIAPIPRDLNDMILAAFDNAQPAAAAPSPVSGTVPALTQAP